MKDSIQDSLNMIVSDDGKLSDAAVRCQLDTKIPSAMCKHPLPPPKFDTQNPVISSLLTQIEIGKKQKEKEIKKQVASAPSVQDLKITKHLQWLSQFNRNIPLDGNDDDDDNDSNNGRLPTEPPLPPPPPYNFPHIFLSPPPSDGNDDNDNNDNTP